MTFFWVVFASKSRFTGVFSTIIIFDQNFAKITLA